MSKFVSVKVEGNKNDHFNIESAGYCFTGKTNYNYPIKHFISEYRLILLTEGTFTLYNSNTNEKFLIHENMFAIINPNVRYHYTQKAHSEDYWVNFFGIDDVMERLNLNGHDIFVASINSNVTSQLVEIFKETITELQFKQFGYDIFAKEKLVQLLLIIGRALYKGDLPASIKGFEKIKPAILEMNNNYQNTLSMDDYAELCHISKSTFMHSFSKIMHTTPIKYINSIKLTNAKQLIIESDKPINEISDILGFSSPLYFSDMFYKEFKIRPTTFRNNYRIKNV